MNANPRDLPADPQAAFKVGYEKGFLAALAEVQHPRASETGAAKLSVRLKGLAPEWGWTDWWEPFNEALDAAVRRVKRGFEQGEFVDR